MKKRILTITVISMLALALMSGCTSKTNESEETSEEVTTTEETTASSESETAPEETTTTAEETEGTVKVTSVENADDYKVVINGVEYCIGDEVSKFFDNGWVVDSKIGNVDQKKNPVFPEDGYLLQLKSSTNSDFFRILVRAPKHGTPFTECYFYGFSLATSAKDTEESCLKDTTVEINGIVLGETKKIEDVAAMYEKEGAATHYVDLTRKKVNSFTYCLKKDSSNNSKDFFNVCTTKDDVICSVSVSCEIYFGLE